VAFTNENSRFRTNTAKGYPHGLGQPAGSVFPDPLFDEGFSLWLEHVIERATGRESYWLMWYDENGRPTIKVSGVMSRDDLKILAQKLIEVP